MNFYKHHIGDYAKKTAALSVLEHGAYLLMLHAYYGTEKPLPFGRDLYRICRAFGKKERAAVDRITELFWTRTDTGFINGRAFEEIEIASELADIAKENGKKGGRPKKPSGLSENNPAGFNLEPSGKAIQTPDSRLHKELRGPATRKLKKCPAEFLPDLTFAISEIPDVDADREAAKFKDWEFKTARSDWAACWRTWIRNAKDRGQYSKRGAVIWR